MSNHQKAEGLGISPKGWLCHLPASILLKDQTWHSPLGHSTCSTFHVVLTLLQQPSLRWSCPCCLTTSRSQCQRDLSKAWCLLACSRPLLRSCGLQASQHLIPHQICEIHEHIECDATSFDPLRAGSGLPHGEVLTGSNVHTFQLTDDAISSTTQSAHVASWQQVEV